MQDKNSKLAKENSSLKMIISQKMQAQEEILKKSIKAEYNQILSYKQMILVIEESIKALEGALEQCKNVQKTLVGNRRMLSDSTNITKNIEPELKDLVDKAKLMLYKEGCQESKENNPEEAGEKKEEKRKETGLESIGISIKNKAHKKSRIDRKGVENDLFSSWGNRK
ncbi:hypothetical protein GINT2_001990 [Glugoides intestinalis]